jgi:phosphoadenosine phosphosulfate reductase
MEVIMEQKTVDLAAEELAGKAPQDVLAWGLSEFGGRVALASSFGAEDVVLIDMLARITDSPRVFAIDTGRLHEETYAVMERIRERYGINVEVYYPDRTAVETLERQHGFYSFRNSPDDRHLCCAIRKVEPLKRALSSLGAWITGLRREQNVTRTNVPVVSVDTGNWNIVKLNPLVDWNNEQVWDYIRLHDVPYNKLHDNGFPSIGCAPCTRAIAPGEHPRAGRWWWESPEQKECGLHVRV